MKRYRVVSFDFDSRARLLSDPISDEWEETSRKGTGGVATALYRN
jgi:hypothetical protein